MKQLVCFVIAKLGLALLCVSISNAKEPRPKNVEIAITQAPDFNEFNAAQRRMDIFRLQKELISLLEKKTDELKGKNRDLKTKLGVIDGQERLPQAAPPQRSNSSFDKVQVVENVITDQKKMIELLKTKIDNLEKENEELNQKIKKTE